MAFPCGRGAPPALSDRLLSLGIGLRPATRDDMDFLRRVYAEMRAPELIAMSWAPTEKAAFCDTQFALQHRHYVTTYPRGDFWIVTRAQVDGAAADIGRLVLERKRRAWRIVDVLLALEARATGIGSALVRWVQDSAARAGAERVDLSVAVNNLRAHALYRHLGFQEGGETMPLHMAMAWLAPAVD